MEVRLHKSLGKQAYQFYKRNSRREVEAGSLIDLYMSLQESQVIWRCSANLWAKKQLQLRLPHSP